MSNDSAIRGRLLVVDDEENQRQMLAGILERVNSLSKTNAKRIAGKNAESLFGL